MKGYDIYKRVCDLLGYDICENLDRDVREQRMTGIINQVADDLKIEPTDGLSKEMPLTNEKQQALLYGCAMMLAVSVGDAYKSRAFADLYHAKRSLALSGSDSRRDVIPVTGDGEN